MDGIDDYIKQAAASVPDPGKEKIFQARDLIRTKFGQDIPDDVVNDFYNTTYLESGRSHYNRNGSVKMSPADPKDGQRAVGWSQIKPGTIAQYGLDPMDERQNIAGGLKYFYDADPNDPVSRRIGYFSGHNSRSQKLYKTKGIIPKGGDFTGTSFQDYIAGTGGFKPVDDYIKSNGEANPNASGIDAYIQQTAKSLDTPQAAPPPTNPANVMAPPQTALPAPAPNAPVATLGGTAQTPATPPTPVPETANTLQAQMASTIDANSPRSAVLLTNGNPVNDYILNSPEAKAMTRVDTPNGPLLVNAAKLKLQPSQVADYVKQNGFAGLIGKAADVGNDTTQNPAVLTTDPKTGTELSASSAPTPEAAAQQAQIDQQAFPGSQTQIVSPQDVIDNRTNGNPFPPPVDASMAGSPEYQAYNEMADRSQAAGYPDGTAPLDDQVQRPAASQQTATQPQTRPRSQQQPASDGSSVSVSLNPGDFKIDGTPVTQINETPQPVEAKTDADILKGQATSLDLDVASVPANADFNKFATEQALRKAAAQYGIDDAKLQEYIANRKAFTDFTPEEIDYYRKNKINPTVNVTNGVVNDLLNYANGTTGIDPALRQNIDLQSSQWRQETESPNLTMPRDFAQEDAAWLNKNAAPIAVAVNPLAVFLPEDMQNDIGASLVGGAAGSGARLWRTLAGIARPINGDLYDEMRQIASANERLESATGTGGAVSHIYKFAGALPGDFSRIYLLTRIPGAAGTVIGMAADQGLQSSGRGESPAQIAKQTVKGGLTGGVLVAAPLSGAVLSGITRKVIPAAVGELGTVILGTAKVSQLFGTPSDKALQEGLLNGLLHLANKGVSMKGKVVRAKSSDGATADVYVDPNGSVKLLKGEVAKPDAEMYVEVEKDANGVYRAKNDITPERTAEDPYSRGNRGNVLGEAPAKRIPEPDPEAVKAVSIDTKAQKVADALADGTPKSLSEIAKAIRSNPGKTQDTVMNLYAAGKIEILPDNKVRLIENVLPSLYDQFDENGRIVPPKADVSQSTAPVVQGENVPQGTSDTAPAVPLTDAQAAERTPEPTANIAAEYKGLTVDHPTSGDRLTFTGETNKNGNLIATNQFGRERTVAPRDADKWLAAQGQEAPATTGTVTHPNPANDGQPILTTTPDGRSVVANPENKSGVSIVTDRSETPQTTTKPRPTTTRFRSLSQFVRANGGIRATKYDSGEHQRISNKETGTTGIINRNSKFTAEQMAEKAWEAGYLRTEWPTIADRNGNDLMGYIEDDIASHKTAGQGKHYSQADIEAIQGDIAEQEAEYRRQQDNAEQAAADYAKQQDEMLTAQQRALADPEVQNLLEKLQEPGQYKTDSAIGAPLNEITAKYLDALERHGITDQYTPGELIDAYRHRKASANDAAGDSAPADEVQPQGDNGTGSERAAETAPVIPQRTSTVSTPSTPTPVTNPEPLTAAMRARVQYALDRKQIVSDIAQRYNLTEEQVRSVQPLQPVGSNGQISYKLRQNFLPNKVETDAGRAEKVAMVNDLAGELGLTEARVTRDTPNADIMNAFDLIRLTIARSFGHDRSSQMSRENWLDFLDARAGSLAEPTVAGMIDALEHQAAWNLKAEPFVNDKNLAQVLEDVDAKYGLANVADFPSLDKEFRARINAIGESYGLKRHAIQKLFSDTFLDFAQEEHGQTGDGRTGQEVSNPVTPQETRGGEPQEQPRDQEVAVAGAGSPEDSDILFSNTFDQTDLFGNPVTPQVSQGSLPFAAPTFTDSGRVKDMEQAYGKPTADYIDSLTNSEDPKLYRTAIKLSDARFMVMQKGEAARQIVEDAADALDTFAMAQQTQSPVDAVLAQQNLDGSGTVADNISPRAAGFAKAMETGAFSRDFERALSEAKTEPDVQFARSNDPMAVINLVKQKLSHFIDRFLAGELKRGESGTVLPVTPDVYRRFGARDLSIEIEPKTLDKVLRNAYKHAGNISRKHIEELPIQLVNPVAIARYVDPQTREQSINVLTGMQDGSGQPIVAGIKFNKKVGRYDVHLVSTVHGKDTRYNFDDWPDKLLYVNTKIARSLPATVPIYGKVVQEAQRANSKILTEADFVKKPDGDIQYNNDTRPSAKTGARLSSGYPGTDSRGIIESLPQKALAFNDANDPQFSRNLQAPNPAEQRAERRELRKKIRDASEMSDTALTAAAKFAVNPQTRTLELNVPGLLVFTRAVRAIPGQQDSSFTGITFNHRSTPKIQAVFDNAVNVLNATGQPRQAARVQAMADAVRAATDPQHGDLIAVLADPSLPLAHRHATQEEMTHRADNRIKEKYQTTFEQTPFIGSRAYATAQKKLLGDGYPISAVHREIIGKLNRDDAALELGLTELEVEELCNIRDAQLEDAGVTYQENLDTYKDISHTATKRTQNYGRKNQAVIEGRVSGSNPGGSDESINQARSKGEIRPGSGAGGDAAIQRAEYRSDAAGIRRGSLSRAGESGDVIGSRINAPRDIQLARNTVTRKVFDKVDKLFQTDSALSTTKALENIVNKGMQQLKAADEDAYEQVLKLAGTQVQATLAAVNNPDIAPDFYSELKRHNLENVRITLELAGLAQLVTRGTDLSVMPKIMGKPSTTMHIGDKLYIVPKWLAAELRPALDKPQDANLIQKVVDKLDVYGMSGPLDLFYHGTNIIATVIGGTPYAGTDILSRTIGNTPVTKWLTTAINIWRSDPANIDPSILREMAEAGVLSSRYAKTTYSANLAARSPLTEKVSILPFKDGLVPDLSPLLNGPKGLDIRARILLWQIGKHMNPNASVTDMADFVNQAGIYNNMLQSQMVRFLKNSRIGRFAVAGTTMSKNGLLMWLNKSPLPNEDLPFVSRTWRRTQQQLGGGPLGVAVLLWLGASLLYRGMFPWKDPESRFMQIPLNPKERNSPFVRRIAGDTGSVYVNLGFFSPLLERGARGLGISGAYNEGILGGNSTQMAEAGLTDVMNTALHPIASSPTTKAAFVAATGKEMQIKSLRKDGESNLQMWETPIPKDSGVGRKLFEGALDLNPFVGNIFHTFGVNRDPAKPSQLAKDELGFILRTTTDIALPRLVKGPSDRSKARAAIQKERRLMEYPRRRQ